MNIVEIGNLKIGKSLPLVLIAGPCVIETEEIVFKTAEALTQIADKLSVPFIFKSSYLKDNRSSAKSYQGPGLRKGLEILKQVKERFGVPVLSDIHDQHDAERAAEVLDVIQIPAYLSMQTSLTLAAARTGKVVNIKKGQFLHPVDLNNVIAKITETGNEQILLTERGACFGYHDLVVDIRSIPILRSLGYPVILDPTHAVRVYGVPSSDPKGGRPEFVPYLSRAGVAAGCDAVFLETHPMPAEAWCDAASQWPINKLEELLMPLIELRALVNKFDKI